MHLWICINNTSTGVHSNCENKPGDCILIMAPQPKQTRGSSKAGCAGLRVNMPLDYFSAAGSEIQRLTFTHTLSHTLWVRARVQAIAEVLTLTLTIFNINKYCLTASGKPPGQPAHFAETERGGGGGSDGGPSAAYLSMLTINRSNSAFTVSQNVGVRGLYGDRQVQTVFCCCYCSCQCVREQLPASEHVNKRALLKTQPHKSTSLDSPKANPFVIARKALNTLGLGHLPKVIINK